MANVIVWDSMLEKTSRVKTQSCTKGTTHGGHGVDGAEPDCHQLVNDTHGCPGLGTRRRLHDPLDAVGLNIRSEYLDRLAISGVKGVQGNKYMVRDILTQVLHVSFQTSLLSHGEKSAVDNILRLEATAHQLAQDPKGFQVSCFAEAGSNRESN